MPPLPASSLTTSIFPSPSFPPLSLGRNAFCFACCLCPESHLFLLLFACLLFYGPACHTIQPTGLSLPICEVVLLVDLISLYYIITDRDMHHFYIYIYLCSYVTKEAQDYICVPQDVVWTIIWCITCASTLNRTSHFICQLDPSSPHPLWV